MADAIWYHIDRILIGRTTVQWRCMKQIYHILFSGRLTTSIV